MTTNIEYPPSSGVTYIKGEMICVYGYYIQPKLNCCRFDNDNDNDNGNDALNIN